MEKEGNELLFSLIDKYIGKKAIVLEIGCGSGELLYKLSERYDCYWRGIDPFSLEKKDNKIQILNISAEDIDSLKENYDIIFSIRSFHHIKNINEFIKGLRKKLKKNGVFILVDWKKGYDTGISEKYFSLYEIKNLFSESDFFIIESGEKETVFYIIIKSLL
jgi:cyclopropane fatty-acyl-phospholipid synthase-like methyltransferase